MNRPPLRSCTCVQFLLLFVALNVAAAQASGGADGKGAAVKVPKLALPSELESYDENDKFGFRNQAGEVVIPARFSNANSFGDGLAPVKLGEKWGFIDSTGAFVIEPKFDEAWPFTEGAACVLVDGKMGFIDRSGNWLIKPLYNLAYEFSEGLASVGTKERMMYLDRTGTVVIELPMEIELAGSFKEGLAWARTKKGKHGYIDRRGQWAIRPIYTRASPFHDGTATVSLDGEFSELIIDHTGRVLRDLSPHE